jgi:putative membrane-bound dehydrogenase-like protein
MPRPILLLALLFFFPPIVHAQLAPEKAMQSFTVAEGLQLELFAAEPMFTNPTCIDIDHKGRVWVCEAVNYRCHLHRKPLNRKEGDRIVILEDTNGDGKADKATTFYQAPDFVAPLGICIAPNPDGKGVKAYVCHSPHIYLFEDKDGDNKADGPPKILLTGFRGFDHDHGVHGIHFGPDGKLYFSVGDQGVKDLQSADGKGRKWTTNNTDCQAGTVWRCNADGTGLELLAHNFRNPYEPAVNSFGIMFMSDNDDDGNQQTRICYVMYGGNYGYWPRGKGESHWHEEQPGVVHKALRTGFGSPTGMCWYEGTLLPKKYHGQLLHTEAGPRHVRCYHVKPKGAGYELEQEILVSSTDNWFRPSDVCVASDGSVFIADWYDPGVGGHGMGDTTRGRIYRLTPKGNQSYSLPNYDASQAEGIVKGLNSSNLAARQFSLDALRFLEDTNQVRQFCELIGQQKQSQPIARSLWAADTLCLADKHRLKTRRLVISDPMFLEQTVQLMLAKAIWTEPQSRLAYYRFLGERQTQTTLFMEAADIEDKVTGEDKWPCDVRREYLLILQRIPPNAAKRSIWWHMKRYDGQDHFYLAALGIAVGTDPKRREIILADFEKHFPNWNDKTAKLVWELRPPQVIAKLDQKLVDPKLTAAQKAFILEILAGGDDQAGRTVLRIILSDQSQELRELAVNLLKRHLPGKWRSLAPTAELREVIDLYLRRPAKRSLAFELIALAEAKEYIMPLLAFAEKPFGLTDDPHAGQSVMDALASFKTPQIADALGKLAETGPLHKQAIRALGQMQTHESLTPLKIILLEQGRRFPLELRLEAVHALANSRQGSTWLLEEHKNKVLPAELVPDVARLLRNSPFQPIRNRALIAFPPPGRLNLQKLPSLEALAKRRGNSDRGKSLVFANKDIACARCHTIQGYGGQIGPDLSTIGVKGSRENLFESVLYPDKAVADQYVQANIETQKGELLTGLVIEETKEHLLLRDANGKDMKIPLKEIVQRAKNPKSIMSTDLVGYLTEEDLIDVVEYLATLKQPALTIEQWHIIGPFPNDMSKAFPPERGVQLAAEYEGKDGKVKWRTVKPDGTGYVDLHAFFAPSSADIVSYLTCEVESPVDQPAVLSFGTDDEAKLWLNGTQVFSHQRHDAVTPHRDRVEVKLKQGKNTILLKINNGDGPHGFYFTVLSDQPLKAGK